MSEQIKYIIQELSKPPFIKSFNMISFDSLEPIQLLQILTDVLSEVDPKQTIDIREEAPDQTAIRIFHLLRVLKYKPPQDDVAAFRMGLVQGDKPVIYPILEWLLQRIPELKMRAYLARFLVKIDVPPEIMQEDGIPELYSQYGELIDQFKELHKQSETLKNAGFNTTEIRKDIHNMDEEKEQLMKRIERLKRKVESHPNSATMMNVARNLRLERDREKKLAEQRQEQSTLIQHAEQRIKRQEQQLRDARTASVGATPEGLFQRLEEETRANAYIVKERLPKDITARRKTLHDLQKIVAEPAMGHSDLETLNGKIKELNSEVNQLIEKRMMSGDPIDDKLSLFRQQAAIIAHKKERAAESLRDIRDTYNHAMQEVEDKRGVVKTSEGGEVLKGEDFKRYVNRLRSKSTIYKKKRSELAEIKAELGVLSRTEEVLRQRDHHINQQLELLETKKGVSGYRATQEELEMVSTKKSQYDERKGETLEDMSDLIRRLTKKITEKKSALAPTIKELRPLRERAKELQVAFDDKKQSYDTALAGLESNMSKLEQEVRAYHEECAQEESRYHYLHCMMNTLEHQNQKVTEEMKTYTAADPQARKKTLREIYNKKILEQENLGKGLREKQKSVRENHGPSLKQMNMWRDVERLLECKQQCFEKAGGTVGVGGGMFHGEQPPAVLEDDRLVL